MKISFSCNVVNNDYKEYLNFNYNKAFSTILFNNGLWPASRIYYSEDWNFSHLRAVIGNSGRLLFSSYLKL